MQMTLFDDPPAPGEKWPRLSVTLTGVKDAHHCWCCSSLGSRADGTLVAWREHDDQDKPTGGAFVILCPACSGRLIEPHPRLYDNLDSLFPIPGLSEVCGDCPHARPDGVPDKPWARCASPIAAFNGGPGMRIHAEHSIGFIDYADKQGRRRGERRVFYTGPATACDGKESR